MNRQKLIRFIKHPSVVFVVLFAVVGTIVLLTSHAAVPTAAVEPEKGTITSPAAIGNNNATSGGQYVQFGSPVSTSTVPWPNFYHKAGAYELADSSTFSTAANLGISIDMGGNSTAAFEQSLTDHHMTHVDMSIASFIYAEYNTDCDGGQGPGDSVSSCTIPASKEQMLETKIAQHIQAVNNDPTMIGYYILDDSPGGDITIALRAAHKLVQAANNTAPIARPTLCGYISYLDSRYRTTSAFSPNPYHGPQSFDGAMQNFDTSACDIVMLYPYADTYLGGTPADDDYYDWSMTNLLPQEFSVMKSKGWNPAKTPLIGVPQAFGGIAGFYAPTRYGLTNQIKAFCDAGAIGIIPYTWHDTNNTGTNANATFMYNNASLQSQFKAGLAACNAHAW